MGGAHRRIFFSSSDREGDREQAKDESEPQGGVNGKQKHSPINTMRKVTEVPLAHRESFFARENSQRKRASRAAHELWTRRLSHSSLQSPFFCCCCCWLPPVVVFPFWVSPCTFLESRKCQVERKRMGLQAGKGGNGVATLLALRRHGLFEHFVIPRWRRK